MVQPASSVAVAAVRRFSVMRKDSKGTCKVLYITQDSEGGTIFVCINSQNRLEKIAFEQVGEVRNVED
jgi:hypothetical protein